MILGVPWGFAVELAEVTDIIEGNRWVTESFIISVDRLGAGEMEHGPEQHRGVTVREHEPIAIGPDGILGIEPHHAVPERVDQRCERHRSAGVSGPGLLDRIDREGADRVDAQLIELRVRHGFSDVHDTHPHGAFEPVTVGVCQPPEGDTLWSTSFGPHVPGSYS